MLTPRNASAKGTSLRRAKTQQPQPQSGCTPKPTLPLAYTPASTPVSATRADMASEDGKAALFDVSRQSAFLVFSRTTGRA
ncbi:MAG: hypothetical protein NC402_07340 [Prevotella sp.]|nr:hypothetical protein [Prevotella sp.]MCM1075547.1 hypothetical protein [Ruminococcus sp.]